ncbi:hypothetical protein NO550_004721 [Escherichia coli]|nr:hypothetical protein [Escherichia coli]
MTKEQLELIAALLAGQQVAIAHLSIKLAEQAGLDKTELADSFRKTANHLDERMRNKKIIALTLNQIADGIDTSRAEGQKDIEEKIKSLLH